MALSSARARSEGDLVGYPGVCVALPLDALLAEVEAWASDEDAPVRRQAARSLRDELDATYKLAGLRVAESLEVVVGMGVDALSRLAQLSDRAPRHERVAIRQELQSTCRTLRGSVTPDLLEAAWLDLLDLFRSPPTCLDRLSGRMATLDGLLVLNGWSRREVWQVLDLTIFVRTERHSRPPRMSDPNWNEAVVSTIRSDPVPRNTVVWLAYENAPIRKPIVEQGSLVLCEARWVVPNATNNRYAEEYPWLAELADVTFSTALRDYENRNDILLVRIELGFVKFAEAQRRVRSIDRTVRNLIGLAVNAKAWRPYGLEVFILDGRGGPASTYVPDHVQENWPEGTFEASRKAEFARDEIGWLSSLVEQASTDLDRVWRIETASDLLLDAREERHAATAVSSACRAIETLLPIAGGVQWHDFVSSYMRANYASDRLSGLRWGVVDVIHGDLPDDLDPWRFGAVENVGAGGRVVLNISRFDALVDLVRPAVPADGGLGASLSMLDRATGGERDDEWEVEADLLANRVHRVRNNVTHGTRTPSSTVDSVRRYAVNAGVDLLFSIESPHAQGDISEE